MKKLYTTLVALLATIQFSSAQWTGGPTGPIYFNGGNVGVGTTSPGYNLEVNNATFGGWSILGIVANAASTTAATAYSPFGGISSSNPIFFTGQRFGDQAKFSIWKYTGTHESSDFVINNLGNVGIGTASPSRKLDILAGAGTTPLAAVGSNGSILIDNVGSGENYYRANSFHQFQGGHAIFDKNIFIGGSTGAFGGTQTGISPQSGSVLSAFYAESGTNTASIGTVSNHPFNLKVNNATVAQFATTGLSVSGSGFFTENLGIGTNDSRGYKLAVNGTIRSKEVKVESGPWPDYVFKPSYLLPTLQDVQAYINKHHHLPEVPSAAEVEKNGVSLGETSSLLLKKIEELTLYLIEKDKQLKKQQDRIEMLEEQSKQLKRQQKQLDELKAQIVKFIK